MSETQNKIVLRYLMEGHTLTPNDALRRFGVGRLAARIYDLRLLGHKINTNRVHVMTAKGHEACVAEYKLIHSKDANTEAPPPRQGVLF